MFLFICQSCEKDRKILEREINQLSNDLKPLKPLQILHLDFYKYFFLKINNLIINKAVIK